jgi:glycerophosphoryl diester phosphodiesterase
MAAPVAPVPPPVGRAAAIAHRGASHVAPENTLSALRSALASGADLMEVDVRRTADGALVLMHDETLARTTDVELLFPTRAPWRVQDLTLEQIRKVDAGSWKSTTYRGEGVPTLSEALEVIDRAGSRLLIEIKEPASHPGVEMDVAALLRARRAERPREPEHVVVQSFDLAAMHRFAWEAPEVPTGVLVQVPTRRLPAVAGWASYVNPHHRRVSAEYVEALHSAGLRCFSWTVDSPRAVRRLLRAGVDGVISNRPEVVRAVRSVRAGEQRAD